VAQLKPQLDAVANLKPAMQDLAALRDPLQRVALLAEPVSRMTGVLNRPMSLMAIAIGALLAWGLVTYLAVSLALAHPIARRA
jgi:hypothetical protein